MPCRSRAAPSESTYSGLRSSRGAAFTLSRGVSPSTCHSAAWRQSSSITHSPIGSISPLCSAAGMNAAGGTRPRDGSFQRRSASTAAGCPLSSE